MNKNMEALNNMVHIGRTKGFDLGREEVIVTYNFRERIKEPVHRRSYISY